MKAATYTARFRPPNPPEGSMVANRPPYGHAVAAFAATVLLYVVTLAPTAWFWDSGEYIAAAATLGIPHPPGNPFFVLLGRLWIALLSPTGLSVAVRMNLLAAVSSAAATGTLFLVAHRVLAGWMRSTVRDGNGGSEDRAEAVVPLVGAWAGAILAATAFTVWNQSNLNEKVYTLSVLAIAVVSWLAILWVDRKDRAGSEWLLILAVYVMALGSTNHLMSVLPAPALALLMLREKPRLFLHRGMWVQSTAAVALGISLSLFLPIRSAHDPAINEGEPTCESLGGAAAAVFSLGRAGCPALAANLTREQYAKPSILVDPNSSPFDPEPRTLSLLGHQFLNYFQYFDWQWARGLAASDLPGTGRTPISLMVLGLGIWGLVVSTKSRWGHGLYLSILALTLWVGLVFYLNFRYGYSLGPDFADRTMREVRERDYFYIASFHLWGFLAGMGLVAVWRWVAGSATSSRRLAVASPILALVLLPLAFNWAWASRAGDYSARDWAYDLLQSVEPYGILFTNGDNDTFPLWYLQEVEGIRQDVTVIVGMYLNTQWYPKQLKRRTRPERQRRFIDDEGLGLYAVPPTIPSQSITTRPDEELDGAGSAVLSEPATLQLGRLTVQYPQGFRFSRGEQIALAIIQDSVDHRPVYFASSGAMAQDVGLAERVVKQGLASKLLVTPPEELPGLVRVSPGLGGEWIDVERSVTLARDVYSYRGLKDRAVWPDMPSNNIPLQFYFLFVQLADAHAQLGDRDETVAEFLGEADRFRVSAEGGSRGGRGG